MRQLIIILIISCGLSSCDRTPDNLGYEQSMTFFKEHTENFLKSELLRYDYNPRTQYSLTTSDTLIYRAFLRREDNELVGVFRDKGFEIFAEQFKIPIDTNSTWDRLSLTTDSMNYILELELYIHPIKVINSDTIKADIKTIGDFTIPKNLMSDPIQYFSQLDKERENYGIVDFSRLRIGEIIEINFSATDYLLYFPPDSKIEEKQFRDYWNKKMKEGKKT
jgi:hypothetical protein